MKGEVLWVLLEVMPPPKKICLYSENKHLKVILYTKVAHIRRLSEHGKQRALRFTAAVRLWEPFKCRRENNREIIQIRIGIEIREPENAGGF